MAWAEIYLNYHCLARDSLWVICYWVPSSKESLPVYIVLFKDLIRPTGISSRETKIDEWNKTFKLLIFFYIDSCKLHAMKCWYIIIISLRDQDILCWGQYQYWEKSYFCHALFLYECARTSICIYIHSIHFINLAKKIEAFQLKLLWKIYTCINKVKK